MDKTHIPAAAATSRMDGEPDAGSSKAPKLWREPAGAWPNSLVLAYVILGYIAGLCLMASSQWIFAAAGVLLVTHAMVIAAYLVHEAAHYTLFSSPSHNRFAGEAMSWVAGSAYASFERIRHLHLRHHRDRADVTCFDYKAFVRARPRLRRILIALESVADVAGRHVDCSHFDRVGIGAEHMSQRACAAADIEYALATLDADELDEWRGEPPAPPPHLKFIPGTVGRVKGRRRIADCVLSCLD